MFTLQYKPHLDDVTLCAIIHNEEVNAAHGVGLFLDSTVPFVGKAIIAYTPSDDKSDQILLEAAERYPHLTLISSDFDGYANMRNIGLKRVRTKYALVLDADELLTRWDFCNLEIILEKNSKKNVLHQKKKPIGYNFKWRNVYPDQDDRVTDCPNPRLFDVSRNPFCNTRYVGGIYEQLWLGNSEFYKQHDHIVQTNIEIKHFCPTEEALLQKKETFYDPQADNKYIQGSKLVRRICGVNLRSKPKIVGVPPWKKPNPKRVMYA